MYNTATNTTSMAVSDLSQGAEYSYTVAGINSGRIVGESSVSSKMIMYLSMLCPTSPHQSKVGIRVRI